MGAPSRMGVAVSGIKQVHAELNAVSAYGHNRRRVVEDWIELMFWAFQRNDPQYLAVLERYDAHVKKRQVAEHFANALCALMAHMQQTNEEVLGQFYMDFCANESLGQFFTPMHLCRLLAQMTAAEGFPEGRTFRVSEPCAGSGRMFVALAQEMTVEQAGRCFFLAQDLDRICCMMTALNMMFFNLHGLIVWGNALNISDVRGAWVTRRSLAWGGSLAEYPKEKAAEDMRGMWQGIAAERDELRPVDAVSKAEPSKRAGRGNARMPAAAPVQLRLM